MKRIHISIRDGVHRVRRIRNFWAHDTDDDSNPMPIDQVRGLLQTYLDRFPKGWDWKCSERKTGKEKRGLTGRGSTAADGGPFFGFPNIKPNRPPLSLLSFGRSATNTMHPGSLELCDRTIRYRIDGSVIWELPVCDIRVIGEMTNDHGPFVDDYSFCFATDGDSWYEGSFYAEGREEFLNSLAIVLGCKLTLRLVGSTDYDSNVLWPPHLAGTPMFSFKPVQPGCGSGGNLVRFKTRNGFRTRF